MEHRRAVIASTVGLHARPAAVLARTAGNQPVAVHIAKVADGAAGDPVDASSVLGLMALGVRHGEVVELSADGTEAAAVLDTLVELLEENLDQPQPA
ncbi:HPr family phosphocarrier protein [Allosaccharopolyspora coralli]|uniref:Phosphocarrier protein HPr n=1 Tax=Allosaccharopolyspora coralli TaxID=2665642 RepID=A0A5Q3Q5R7_9PSEU|nr:HPr family phosphocarrier protein [Allosaccharopolyspora coralli]QGK69812.1 HPr family phosphocarrier protein [Allosaccharopolyspora coralli]